MAVFRVCDYEYWVICICHFFRQTQTSSLEEGPVEYRTEIKGGIKDLNASSKIVTQNLQFDTLYSLFSTVQLPLLKGTNSDYGVELMVVTKSL